MEPGPFSLQQRCVLLNASEEGDLAGLLWDWSADWTQEELLINITELGGAIVELVTNGLVEAVLSETPDSISSLPVADIAAITRNPKAWWNGDDGLEQVLWLNLTDRGWAALSGMTREELYAFRNRT